MNNHKPNIGKYKCPLSNFITIESQRIFMYIIDISFFILKEANYFSRCIVSVSIYSVISIFKGTKI